jgi:hypothetical protein
LGLKPAQLVPPAAIQAQVRQFIGRCIERHGEECSRFAVDMFAAMFQWEVNSFLSVLAFVATNFAEALAASRHTKCGEQSRLAACYKLHHAHLLHYMYRVKKLRISVIR